MSGHRTIELADASVSLKWVSPRDRQYLAWFFGDARPAAGAPDLRIVVLDSPVVVRVGEPDFVDGPVSIWFGGDCVHLEHAKGGGAYVSTAEVGISPSSTDSARWKSMRQLLVTALSWWFERRDAIVLHAAVVAHGPDAVLIAGPTGRGKSTCTVAARAAGWDILSDDLAIVSLDGVSRPKVFGVPKLPMVDNELVDHVSLQAERVPDDDRKRVMLVDGVTATGWRQLRAIAVVDHDDGAGVVEALDHERALAAIIASWPDAARADALHRQFTTLVGLASLPTFRLALSSTPHTRIVSAAESLTEIWDRSS